MHSYVAAHLCVYSLTFVGWLVTNWSTLTKDTEIKEDAALSFGSILVPHIGRNKMQELLAVSHTVN